MAYEKVADAEFAHAKLQLPSPLSLREWLAVACRTFVCPLSGAQLIDGGAERELTVHNLAEYVSLVSSLWLGSGVRRQAISFHEGIADLCPSPDVLLAPFSLAELQTLLCGTRRVEWSEAELRAMLRPAAPLTKDSPVICHLVAELLHMGNEARRQFLSFVTACPHLPPVGVSVLAINVQPQEAGRRLPSAHTCTATLRLPAFDSALALRGAFEEVFANIEAGGLHEQASR